MNFFDDFMNFFDDKNSFIKLLEILGLDQQDSLNKVLTYHNLPTGEIVLSVFEPEEFELIREMSLILNKDTEDIIRGLGPDEVLQLRFHPDQGLPPF